MCCAFKRSNETDLPVPMKLSSKILIISKYLYRVAHEGICCDTYFERILNLIKKVGLFLKFELQVAEQWNFKHFTGHLMGR